mgnify:CR=1 FL=1
MNRPIRMFTFAAPSRFYAMAGTAVPWCWAVAVLFAVAALYVGFFVAPTDATQGDSYRIIFIHVPAAWMSMVLYMAMAFWAAIGWSLHTRLAAMLARGEPVVIVAPAHQERVPEGHTKFGELAIESATVVLIGQRPGVQHATDAVREAVPGVGGCEAGRSQMAPAGHCRRCPVEHPAPQTDVEAELTRSHDGTALDLRHVDRVGRHRLGLIEGALAVGGLADDLAVAGQQRDAAGDLALVDQDRKSTRLNSSHT